MEKDLIYYIDIATKKLDSLLESVIDNIENLSLEDFLNNSFDIVRSLDLIEDIGFSTENIEDDGVIVFPVSIKNQIIGYLFSKPNKNFDFSGDFVRIILYHLRYLLFIFLSFKEIYDTIYKLRFNVSKFEAYKKAFYDISKVILSSLSEEFMLKIICQVTQDVLLCSACAIVFKNKVVYTASNKLIEQELNFIIPEVQTIVHSRRVFYKDWDIIELDNVYLRYLKRCFIKSFVIPAVGSGSFLLFFVNDVDVNSLDLEFISTVSSSVASALEAKFLLEQLSIKSAFLEKLFVNSPTFSEASTFEETYHLLFKIINDIFDVRDFVIFKRNKVDMFLPDFVRLSDLKLVNFVESLELSLTIINDELFSKLSNYQSIFVIDSVNNDFIKFFDLIFNRPYVIVPIVEGNFISAFVAFSIDLKLVYNYSSTLEILFNHLSIFFSHIFLRISAYERLLFKSRENEIINKIIANYSSIMDINVLIDSFVKEIKRLVGYTLPVFIYYKNNSFIIVKTVEQYKSLVLTLINNLPSVIREKIKNRIELSRRGNISPFLITNLELFFDDVNLYDFIRRSNIKSLFVLPLRNDGMEFDSVLLVFSLNHRLEQEYVDLLYNLSHHFSVFLRNASVYSFLEERLKVTDILYNFLIIITSVLDPNNIIMNTRDFLEEIVKPQLFLFLLKKYNHFDLVFCKPENIYKDIDLSNLVKILSFIGSSFANINSKNIFIEKSYNLFWNEIAKVYSNIRQIFVIPIVYINEVLGYIVLGLEKEGINDTFYRLLMNISYAIAAPLKNSVIMQEQVEISNIIRQSLVTKIDYKSIKKKGIDFFFKHVSSREITADWLEIIDKEDSLVAIVADVSGKGAKSAIYTAQAKFAAKSLFFTLDDFELSVNQLNKILSSTVEGDTFITMVAIELRREGKNIFCNYLNAGHEPFFVIKKDGNIEILSTKDVPLCIMESYYYKPVNYVLEEGDIIFLYTDGVVDIKNERGETLGREGLLRIVRNISKETNNVKDLTNRLYVEIMRFSASPLSNPPDDMTIMFMSL